MPSPVRDYSICESNSPICLNKVDDHEEYINQLQQALYNSNPNKHDVTITNKSQFYERAVRMQQPELLNQDDSIVLTQVDQTIQLSPMS